MKSASSHAGTTIVDYGGGNLTSVARAVSYLGFECVISGQAEKILKADRIIFPGVGAAGSAMKTMKEKGIDEALRTVFVSGRPMLGICVGSQIIMEKSAENNTACLALIKGEVKAFSETMVSEDQGFLKVPHMGWNTLSIVREHPLFFGIQKKDAFYFVHSFYPVPENHENIFGKTEYGIEFASAVGEKNLFATQFHLEKSGKPGLLILNNFCGWSPC
ncbi:MAG: imidazole glycerol phosphate synthase subunit HisH [Thermodesulfobacteriota bacterium]|nr:imidazole glycerol phosphate synthase subunit HisH [Thermodesulfobacteriota bacterium]